jgi:membrane-bound metal-dependent hydrolase YbcI (DUF457 family)
MPSPVGHSLAGLAAAWAADVFPGRRDWRAAPGHASWFRRAGGEFSLLCAALGAAADLDLFLGSNAHRTFTHSIGAVALIGVLAAVVATWQSRPPWRVAWMCASAYATHLLLDWMAADSSTPPPGLEALWPFTHAWFISGWDLFKQLERRHLLAVPVVKENLLAVGQEIAILGPVVVGVWLVRVKALAGLAAEPAGGDHSPQ